MTEESLEDEVDNEASGGADEGRTSSRWYISPSAGIFGETTDEH